MAWISSSVMLANRPRAPVRLASHYLLASKDNQAGLLAVVVQLATEATCGICRDSRHQRREECWAGSPDSCC